MSLATETGVDLAFDTEILSKAAKEYGEIAVDLRNLSSELDACLTELAEKGWTTNAGQAFQKMVSVNWKDNIEKYAALLDTLKSIMVEASNQYQELVDEIEATKL